MKLSTEEVLQTISEICNQHDDEECIFCELNGMCDAWNIGMNASKVIDICRQHKIKQEEQKGMIC